jgi:hypothetical protein
MAQRGKPRAVRFRSMMPSSIAGLKRDIEESSSSICGVTSFPVNVHVHNFDTSQELLIRPTVTGRDESGVSEARSTSACFLRIPWKCCDRVLDFCSV